MNKIPNKAYVSINETGIMVGGKPATKYYTEKIYDVPRVCELFKQLKSENPKIKEIQVMISKTSKKILGKSGKPSWIPVPYTQCKNSWVRIKLTDDSVSDWFYTGSYYSVFDCAAFCAESCVEKLHLYKHFVEVVLNSAKHIDVKQNNKIGMLYNRAKSFFHQIRQGGKTK